MPCAVLTKKSLADQLCMGVKQEDCPPGAYFQIVICPEVVKYLKVQQIQPLLSQISDRPRVHTAQS